jgi:hypothetical protein
MMTIRISLPSLDGMFRDKDVDPQPRDELEAPCLRNAALVLCYPRQRNSLTGKPRREQFQRENQCSPVPNCRPRGLVPCRCPGKTTFTPTGRDLR